MKALCKPVSSGKVFVAGEFWKPTDGNDPKMEAQEQGFGIPYKNGSDLSKLKLFIVFIWQAGQLGGIEAEGAENVSGKGERNTGV